jgi:hypothetical protein
MDKTMKIKDLIAKLQDCEPDGTVVISLDGALLYGDESLGDVEHSFEPLVECLFSKSNAERSDSVYIRLSHDETERIIASRQGESEVKMKTIVLTKHPSVVTNAQVAIAIALTQQIYTDLLTVVDNCNLADENRNGATTHGKLDVSSFLGMLAEDAAMTNTRPGSWEAANLQQVLDSHGYQ